MPVSVGTELPVGTGHTAARRQALLERARASIDYGLQRHEPLPTPSVLPDWLQKSAATFVTLTVRADGLSDDGHDERLRGCIGSLQAYRSLAEDVSENAYAAAFRDPRFLPVSGGELAQLRIELAVLSAAQPLSPAHCDADLLAQLVPGRDGLVLVQQGRRATFLPKVWSHFAEPGEFLRALRQKVGLAPTFDSTAQYFVYQVEAFAEP